MSDIGSRTQVARPATQLPVDWYLDDSFSRLERERLFDAGSRYVGHELAVPEVGNYLALPQEHGGRALVRRSEGIAGIELISNVCRHRQAIMLQGRGSTGRNIVCPLHRWTYGLDGQLLGAPHFADTPCLNLERFPLRRWNGLLFDAPTDPSAIEAMTELENSRFARYFDFKGYKLGHVEMHECHYNWKSFIEVYLEDYHVGAFHPGLSQFVDCENLAWEFGKHYSVQTVGLRHALQRPGSATYERWHAQCRRWFKDALPELGAVWLTLYPNVMLEWYPGVITVSTLHPMGVDRTMNIVEFYYPEEIADFEPEFVAAQQAAYMETAREDDEIAERMDAGRKRLYERGVDERGPYQSPFEDGMQHFHEWLRGRLNRPVGPTQLYGPAAK